MGPIEKEFDPTIYTAEYVTMERDEDLAAVFERVEEAWTRTPNVIVIIPRGARAFNATQDFMALGKLQGGREVRVSVASPDVTILGLARVLGFYVVELPDDHPAILNDPILGNGTIDGDEVEKP